MDADQAFPLYVSGEQAFRLYINFIYPELKSLGLQFLILVSSVLTFSVTFADKVVGLGDKVLKRTWPLLVAWLMFLFAIILSGYGLSRLFKAAEVAQGWNPEGMTAAIREQMFNDTTKCAYWSLKCAGVTFIIGMAFLAFGGFFMKRFHKD